METTQSTFVFPDPKTREPGKRRVQRMLEMIPGTLTWTTLLGMVAFSYFLPVWAAVFIITFDIYWIYRAIYISIFSLEAQWNISEGKKIHWWERVQGTSDLAQYAEELRQEIARLKHRCV